MKYTTFQYSIIFFLSLALGVFITSQYKTVSSHNNNFEENNVFRELRILFEGNNEMKEKVETTKENIAELSSVSALQKNAKEKIKVAQDFSGKNILDTSFVNILIEGELTLKDIIEFINSFLNAGAKNIELNGIILDFETAGLDQSGGQILLGGTPINGPYLFKVYGNTDNLIKLLDPETGALQPLAKENIKISLSL